jgi:parallel beta-helix repeat protein
MVVRRDWLKAVLYSGAVAALAKALSTAAIAATPVLAPGEIADTSFGPMGDPRGNDRLALQRAIDSSVGKTLVITGPRRIDVAGLKMRTGSRVRFAPNASVKLLKHNAIDYAVFQIADVQRVVLQDAVIDGSKELNAATGGEWGMGISVLGSSDVTIISPTTTNCWGDGIYIAGSFANKVPYSSKVKVFNHHASGCRRQGVSIISGVDVLFDHPVWTDIQGTAPSAGLDIEPNTNTDVIENIRIVSPYTRNCEAGILVYLKELPGLRPKNVTISITGHRDEDSRGSSFIVSGLRLRGYTVTGSITSTSAIWKRPGRGGFVSEDNDAAGPKITVTDAATIQ